MPSTALKKESLLAALQTLSGLLITLHLATCSGNTEQPQLITVLLGLPLNLEPSCLMRLMPRTSARFLADLEPNLYE
ncbi:hypothetical protein D3C86_2016610 [compost metagenome]